MARLPPKCFNCIHSDWDTLHCDFLDRDCADIYKSIGTECGVEYHGDWELYQTRQGKKEYIRRMHEDSYGE